MCLTTQAMFLFVSMLSSDIIEPAATHIRINAEAGAVVWQYDGENWCLPVTAHRAVSQRELAENGYF